jgi:glycosyltransferase involved in cell wall biosynthesis
MSSGKKLLIIGTVWPEPKSTAAGNRMLQLIDLFKSKGFEITFACAASKNEYSFDLSTLAVQTASITLNCDSFDAFVKDLNPLVVIFDRFITEEQFGWRVCENCRDALRILDTEDLHFLRKARQEGLKAKKSILLPDLQNELAKREIASIYRCDLSLIISDFEMQLLLSEFNVSKSLLHYLPFLFDSITVHHIESLPDFHSRQDFVTIGNFLHAPNLDAALHLKQNIWPLIHKELPNARMLVYGAYASKQIEQLNDPKKQFFIMGRAEDAHKMIKNARVFLAPLRFGAGLKGKLADAMICGTPSLTSSVGAEAMHGTFPWPGYITDQNQEFAENAVKLYTNELLWNNASKNGFEIINQLFDKALHREPFMERVEYTITNSLTHRQNNFIGNMLMHHTLSSTKYLSKWIQLKNAQSPNPSSLE